MSSIPTTSTAPVNIGLVGAGKVAGHLARALHRAGHRVAALYNRSAAASEALQQQLPGSQVLARPDFSNYPVQVIIMAIADAALPTVAQQVLRPEGCLLVHTSGTAPLSALRGTATYPTGVFYPLQTFSQGTEPDMAQVPFCLEAQQPQHLALLQGLAQSIGAKAWPINSSDRQQLHVAAVIACNFTNHLLYVAQQHLQQHNIAPELLHPLIQETIQKSFALGPFAAQTGPAVRGDVPTLQRHLQLLHQDPLMQQVYRDLSTHIAQQHGQSLEEGG